MARDVLTDPWQPRGPTGLGDSAACAASSLRPAGPCRCAQSPPRWPIPSTQISLHDLYFLKAPRTSALVGYCSANFIRFFSSTPN